MNRFFDVEGAISIELAPWMLKGCSDALFRLMVPLRFDSTIAGGVIVVPVGFESDLASIPREFWGLMSPDDPCIALAAWVHDYLYTQLGVITLEDGRSVKLARDQADRILAYEAMPELGAPKYKCDIVYCSVRAGGESHWSPEAPQPAAQPTEAP